MADKNIRLQNRAGESLFPKTKVENILGLDSTLDLKQNKLTAGTGITIENDVISTTGGGGTWGSITGTLADQTDLQSALDLKQGTLTAGENITIDSNNVISTSSSIPQIYTENIISPSSSRITIMQQQMTVVGNVKNFVCQFYFNSSNQWSENEWYGICQWYNLETAKLFGSKYSPYIYLVVSSIPDYSVQTFILRMTTPYWGKDTATGSMVFNENPTSGNASWQLKAISNGIEVGKYSYNSTTVPNVYVASMTYL